MDKTGDVGMLQDNLPTLEEWEKVLKLAEQIIYKPKVCDSFYQNIIEGS